MMNGPNCHGCGDHCDDVYGVIPCLDDSGAETLATDSAEYNRILEKTLNREEEGDV